MAESYIKPEYRKTSAGHKPVGGVQFYSYVVGILAYARISEDGQIMVRDNGHHRSTYYAAITGHGPLTNAAGATIRFRTQEAATRAAVKKFKELKPNEKD